MPTFAADGFGSMLDRRNFMRLAGGLAVSGALHPRLGATEVPARRTAKSCILVYLLGGPPHLDMWDLKPDAPEGIRGPFKPIAANVPGVFVCEHLPKLARMADRYALVRSVSHNNNNHTPMIYYTLTGRQVERPEQDNDVRPPQRTDSPHLGAVLAKFKGVPRGLPGYVAIPELGTRSSTEGEFKRGRVALRGGGSGFLGPLVDPFCIDGEPGAEDPIAGEELIAGRLERREAILAVMEGRSPALAGTQIYSQLHKQAVTLTGTRRSATRPFLIDGESSALQERYGRHRLGKSLLLARRLAEAGVPMISIHFNEMSICDGWDTHSHNFTALKDELLPMLDQGLTALLGDLEQRGLLDETLVVVMGEFGRTPRINKDAGRDHWGSCQTVLLAGGGIKGGVVYGASDRIGAFPASLPVDPVDLHATIYHCMGLDPERTIYDHLQRPFPLSTGRVIEGLL